jgi:hypothetical protein
MPLVRGHFRRTRSGLTFVGPSFRRSSGSGALGVALLVMIGVVVSVILAIVQFVLAHWLVIVGVMATGGAVVAGVLLGGWLRQRRVEAYLQLAHEAVGGFEDRFQELARLARRVPTDDQRRTLGEEEIYRGFIAQILADGQVTDAEWARLQCVNELFAFDATRALAIREEAFDGLMAWVGLDLTEAQEGAIRTVAARLELPRPRTEAQLAVVSARRRDRERQTEVAAEREARQAAIAAVREREAALEAEREREARLAAQRERQAKLEAKRQQLEVQRKAAAAVHDCEQRVPIAARVKLRRGESCWFAIEARLQDRKASRAGQLLVTNKRILFVSDSVVSVALAQVLDVAADPDAGLLRLIKDGRKTPYEFLLEEPLVALAHVERSLTEA